MILDSLSDCERLLCFRYYDGATLECLAQTKPLVIKEAADKLRKLLKTKHKADCNGIENVAFQEDFDVPKLKSSSSLEELTTNSKEIFSGVKKKSGTGLVRSESTNIGGTKKKIRPKVQIKQPSKEYYQIWAASTSTQDAKEFNPCDKPAPPLPPRTALHRPLERSHALHDGFKPPEVLRQHKPKVAKKPEDTFEFDLIDTDETDQSLSPQISEKDIASVDVTTSTPTHKMKTALMENGKKLIGSDNYVTTFLSKNLELERRNSSPSKEVAHQILEAKDSQSSISTYSSSSMEGLDQECSSHLMLKPHKPLVRHASPLKAACCSNDASGEPPKTPLHERVSSSSEASTESNENCSSKAVEIQRPHNKALTRVAGMLSDSLPVCPPTPTHHAKRTRKADLKPPTLKCASPKHQLQELAAASDARNIDIADGRSSEANACETAQNLPEAEKDSPRLSLIAVSELRAVDTRSPELRSQDLLRPNIDLRFRERMEHGTREAEASGGMPFPLRHLRSARLPSIPERSHRILTVSDIPGECEEPLPPCEYILFFIFIQLYD